MKLIIILAIIACALNVTLAFSYHKVDKAHSDVMSHIQGNLIGIRMMSGNTFHLECFNGFIPLINSLATKARDVSNGCVNIANFEKDQELAGLAISRATVAAEVEKITQSFTDCSKKGGLEFFQCLQDNAEANRKLMEIIKVKSEELMSDFNDKYDEIERKEETCIMKAVDNAKAESDQAYVDLKSCIRDGPIIETQIDGENSTTEASQE